MKKLALILGFILLMTLPGGCQDKTFTKNINVISITFPDGTVQTTAATGSGTVTWTSISGKPTTLVGYGITDAKPLSYVPTWTEITGKPALFDGTWTSLSGKPVFAPVATSGSYTDLKDQPPTIDLVDALAQLGFKLYPPSTTVQINAFVVPTNLVGLVYDIATQSLKYYNGSIWKVFTTGN